ncbi:HU family DNA-binding protein [Actinomadura rudentiformis]|uniref:HU family DNA-binding protein n=1 Tax=Actinomadura rudentiformis TaxID=359158 RepID=A0A6H9YZI7_9ACTN|nr:HU family DNA-binding protein [Actinomadura rudentiformis]KAB2348279.1 HU family DNA-binding protein [Actinomadura rudentiformis]
MNKSELIEAVAARAGSDPAAARRHVDAIFETIMENVAAGERVLVTGFGTFDSLDRPARQARNPRTGLPVEVAAAQVPRFRIGQTFKNRVANGSAAEVEAEVVDVPKSSKAKKDKKAKKSKDTDGKKASAKKATDTKKASAKKAKKSKKS